MIVIQGGSPGHFQPFVNVWITKDVKNKKYILDVELSGGVPCNCRVMKPNYRRVIYTGKFEDGYEIVFQYSMMSWTSPDN